MYTPVAYSGSKEIQDVASWVHGELIAIAQSFFDLDRIRLVQQDVAPAKPRTGDVVLADGSNWNPGSGAGFYGYYGGAWVKLG